VLTKGFNCCSTAVAQVACATAAATEISLTAKSLSGATTGAHAKADRMHVPVLQEDGVEDAVHRMHNSRRLCKLDSCWSNICLRISLQSSCKVCKGLDDAPGKTG